MSRSFRTLAVYALTAAVFSTTLSLNNTFRHGNRRQDTKQIPIWPGAAPDPVVHDGPEYLVKVEDDLVAGKPWISDERVSVPTMTVYPPRTGIPELPLLFFQEGVIRSSLWI